MVLLQSVYISVNGYRFSEISFHTCQLSFLVPPMVAETNRIALLFLSILTIGWIAIYGIDINIKFFGLADHHRTACERIAVQLEMAVLTQDHHVTEISVKLGGTPHTVRCGALAVSFCQNSRTSRNIRAHQAEDLSPCAKTHHVPPWISSHALGVHASVCLLGRAGNGPISLLRTFLF